MSSKNSSLPSPVLKMKVIATGVFFALLSASALSWGQSHTEQQEAAFMSKNSGHKNQDKSKKQYHQVLKIDQGEVGFKEEFHSKFQKKSDGSIEESDSEGEPAISPKGLELMDQELQYAQLKNDWYKANEDRNFGPFNSTSIPSKTSEIAPTTKASLSEALKGAKFEQAWADVWILGALLSRAQSCGFDREDSVNSVLTTQLTANLLTASNTDENQLLLWGFWRAFNGAQVDFWESQESQKVWQCKLALVQWNNAKSATALYSGRPDFEAMNKLTALLGVLHGRGSECVGTDSKTLMVQIRQDFDKRKLDEEQAKKKKASEAQSKELSEPKEVAPSKDSASPDSEAAVEKEKEKAKEESSGLEWSEDGAVAQSVLFETFLREDSLFEVISKQQAVVLTLVGLSSQSVGDMLDSQHNWQLSFNMGALLNPGPEAAKKSLTEQTKVKGEHSQIWALVNSLGPEGLSCATTARRLMQVDGVIERRMDVVRLIQRSAKKRQQQETKS